MKRRNLLAAGAGVALAPLLTGRAQAALAGKSAIVIGSGTGGPARAKAETTCARRRRPAT